MVGGFRDLLTLTIHWFAAWFTTRIIKFNLNICRDVDIGLSVCRDADFTLSIDRAELADMGV